MADANRRGPEQASTRWPHRLAWLTVCLAFSLVWLGGTVTTYEAGMAVEDWPTTFGYWFYCPLHLWLGTWDVFLEHTHRMLAQLVGLSTIVLAVLIWKSDRRRWMWWLAAAAVAVICFQGLLGGLRVLGDARMLARIHACTAPLFFALAAAMVAWTSPAWLRPDPPASDPAARRLHWLSPGTTLGIYALIVLGAQLRHPMWDTAPGWFLFWLWTKLIAVGLVATAVAWLAAVVLQRAAAAPILARRARWLVLLFCVQLLLGAGTWVVNYNWPAWSRDYVAAIDYTVLQEGRLQVLVTTAHAAVGALSLVAALSLTLWSFRRLRVRGSDS
ncbi:MAG: COX15/CtaA family protein [Pirellulales bacterium]|nr:COX15/CtaA family protein [Pirellulales bacterium]